MQYKHALTPRFWQSMDKLLEAIKDYRLVLRIIKLKEKIQEVCSPFDEVKLKLSREYNKETDEEKREELSEQLNKLVEEVLDIEKITIDGVEDLELDGLTIERIRHIVNLPE